ncbi:tRNA pseudouridine(55) synthase TruB [Candidatus Saccharibacteria bacterium]|nr:MAG: tRNA pseudouridine(55) synthase TruB [Candidatus Saccharibacteria bacterium]
MQGLLLIDKPAGWTSFDVVNYVRKIVAQAEGKKPKNCKVGHTGTLDPLATGLLVILVGKEYTRRAAELSKHDKTYEVTMKLGQTSTTGDDEGEKTPVNSRIPGENEVTAALKKFTGNIMQTPPIYSAIKINGQKAYDLARKGKEVKLEPRPVTIYEIRNMKYSYPLVRFTCDVSSGTYIRSLVADVGEALGTGAYMSGLRRTKVGDYDLANAAQLSRLGQVQLADLLQ